jgi:hypothetical protein
MTETGGGRNNGLALKARFPQRGALFETSGPFRQGSRPRRIGSFRSLTRMEPRRTISTDETIDQSIPVLREL